MGILDSQRDDFATENLPAYLLLGLVSALRRLDPLLPAPPPEGTESPAKEGPPLAPGAERLHLLVLGLVSFRRQLLGHLPSPPEPEAVPPAHAEPSPLPPPRELLR